MSNPGFLLLDALLGLTIGTVVLSGAVVLVMQAQEYEMSLAAVRAARESNLVRAYGWARDRDLTTTPANGWRLGESLSLVTPCNGVATLRAVGSSGMRSVPDELGVVVIDSEESSRLGGDCSSFGLVGLQLRHASTLVLGARVIAHGVDCLVRNGRVYALVAATSTQIADPDLFVIDMTEPSVPVVVSTLDVGNGVFSVDSHLLYAYLGLDAAASQIAVVDITDMQHPIVTMRRSLAGVTGSFPEARAVSVYDGVLYAGTYETAGPELHFFNVANGSVLDTLASVSFGHSIRSFLPYRTHESASVRRLLYVASSGDAEELVVFDVTDASHPIRVAALDLPGAGNATALARIGTEVLVGRQQVASQPTLDVVDVRDPVRPVRIGGTAALLKSGSVVNGLVYSNHYLVFTSTDATKSLGSCSYEAGSIFACSHVTGYPDPGRVDVCDGLLAVPTQHALAVLKTE